MAHAVKEEEFGDLEGLDEHGKAGADAGQKSDYIYDTNGIENNVPWTRQRFLTLPERHLWRFCLMVIDYFRTDASAMRSTLLVLPEFPMVLFAALQLKEI